MYVSYVFYVAVIFGIGIIVGFLYRHFARLPQEYAEIVERNVVFILLSVGLLCSAVELAKVFDHVELGMFAVIALSELVRALAFPWGFVSGRRGRLLPPWKFFDLSYYFPPRSDP